MNYNDNNYPNYNPQLAPQTPPAIDNTEYFQNIDINAQNAAPQYNQAPGAPFYQSPPIYGPAPYNPAYNYPRKNNAALIVVIVIIAAILIFFTGIITLITNISRADYYYEEPYGNVYEVFEETVYEEGSASPVSIGETFEFEGFEVTIHGGYSFTFVDNEYSDFYNMDLVKIPVTIKNISGSRQTFESYNIKVFLTSGIETDDYSGYFFDDSIDSATEMRNGAEQEVYLYFLYDGDGEYFIVFDSYSDDSYEISCDIVL